MAKVFDGNHEFVLNRRGSDGAGEAKLLCLGDALVGTKGGADFPAEANFTKNNVVFVEFTTGDGGSDGEADGEVGARVVKLHAADDINKNIFVLEFELRAFFEYGNQEVKAIKVEARRGALRIAKNCEVWGF